MEEGWRIGHHWSFNTAVFMVVLLLFLQHLSFSSSLNSEGLALLRFRERVVRDPFGALSNWDGSGADIDPCSWFGVECSNGKVVILNLRDLCLGGTLTPEIGKIPKLKSIILRNNSFFGTIPKEIGELKELEVLDLGYNNFTGSFPSDFGNNPSLQNLLLDNNQYLGSVSPEAYELKTLSELQVEENQLTTNALRASCDRKLLFSWKTIRSGDTTYRRLLQRVAAAPAAGPHISLPPLPSHSPSPSPSHFPSPSPSNFPLPSLPPANPPTVVATPPQLLASPTSSPDLSPSQTAGIHSKSKHHIVLVLAGIVGGSVLTLILAIGIIFLRSSKVVTVKPWVTGLSGQLQKAFVTGVPKVKRAELEAACEGFSNIIGSYWDGTVYKGTLSSGVEIAVTSTSIKSRADWSKSLETQFRKKIDTLSKVNHKNFVNLIGFCVEDNPFTRMMVFEYAPNGTLFEHLHIQEAEHLDWRMRLRVAMGMAYCLEHLHQLTPPVAHRKLQSSSIYLTEDYAAKVSDFSFWNDTTTAKTGSASMELLEMSANYPESNVYNFGVILFEMITGRIPFAVDDSPVEDWASAYLKVEQPLKEMVDPTLKSFQENEIEKLLEVIKDCVHPDPKQRPTMRDIAAKLKEITAMGPDGAVPKLSPLWWAELEIMSTEASSEVKFNLI
ncbi:inactive receptor-like serine/threonine-protein kinase At2g40270 isoform X2 [Mangifera indica]|uniref:inactive receptor-like serine/threonine-protein kinase At2g40270 isoform X2 n=1 Tax=Mangifera indica TaxID=29780 RepID=UPI001CFA6B3B|nr:inactive receptor-like serine/threonine-protein kinase At2g40270 isoform X2 [Mangifera indica]